MIRPVSLPRNADNLASMFLLRLLRLQLRFRTIRRTKKEGSIQPAFIQTRLIFLRSGSLNKKTGFDTLWHDCFYIDFLHMTSLHEKKEKTSVHTRGTGSWGKKTKAPGSQVFHKSARYACHKNSMFHYGSSRTETRPTHRCTAGKEGEISSDLSLIKADLRHTE